MKKILSLFMAVMATLALGAKDVVFDFDNDATALFGIEGRSSGSGATAVPDGDITEAVTATVDGVSVTVSTSTTTTANRLWTSAPVLRMYGGTMTISAGAKIKSIVFDAPTWDKNNKGNAFDCGAYDADNKTWTADGDGAEQVVLTIGSNTQFKTMTVTVEDAAAPALATLEVGTEYNEDQTQCTLVVTPTKEGTMLYWTDEENGEPMGMLNGDEPQPVVAYTSGRGEEAGTQVWQIYVYEVEMDEDYNMTVIAQGYEQVNLVAPKAKLELAMAYSEDNSSCDVTATPTKEGTSFVISIDGGEEWMELPAEGYQVAWLESLADEFGICTYNVVVKEVIYDEDFNMTEVSTAEEQVKLAKPAAAFPAKGVAYEIRNVDAGLNLTISADLISVNHGSWVYFTEVDGGYALSNGEGLYLKKGANNWALTTTTDLSEAYTITLEEVEGGYKLNEAVASFGLDGTEVGAKVWGDKKTADKHLVWTVTPVVEGSYIVVANVANGGVVYNGEDFEAGTPFTAEGLTAEDLAAIAVEGYNDVTVTVNGSAVVVAYNKLVKLAGDATITIGDKATGIVATVNPDDNSHWYIMTQIRKGETPMYVGDDGNLKRAAAEVAAASLTGTTVAESGKYLVRFLATDTEDIYNIQLANGNYVAGSGTPGQGAVVPTAATPSNYAVYVINNEGNDGTHFGWNLNDKSGKRVDNNGAGGSLSFWDAGEITTLDGNSDWSIYEVTFDALAIAELEVGTEYNEDHSVCTLVVTPSQEGTMLYWTDEENGEPMGMIGGEGAQPQVVYTPGRGEEAGTQVWQIYVYEVDEDMNVVAMGYEQVNLVAPKPVLELATAYNEDNSACVVTATPTQEGTSFVISIDGGEEFMELPAEGYTVAWLEAQADEQGICIYNIVVKEVIYDEEYNMTEVSTVEGQIHLNKPIVIEPVAGDSKENPVVLTESWTMIPAAEVGKDEANVTYFSYTAEHAGQFVFSCNPGKITNCTLPELSEEQYMGMGTGYGKVVAKGETVTFSAILPAVFEGVAYNENGEEIEGETELYDVDTYYITAEVTALPDVAPEKPAAPAFSELVADNATIYYLYNTEAGAFFMSANDWSTRASVDASFGFEFKIEANGEGKYILHDNVKARYGANGARDLGWKDVFAESATSIYVDRGNQPNWDNWTITPQGDGTYTIGNEAVAGLLGLKAGQNIDADSRLYFVEEGATTWAFVSEADYAAYWEAAADYVAYQKIQAAKDKIYAMANELNSTNVYTAEAKAAFDEKYPVSVWAEAADYNTLTAEEADAAEKAYKANFSVTGWHAANDIDDLLTSAWEGADGNFGGKYYINTWSTEGENDGSDFKVPFFEYWTGDGDKLGNNVMTATMTGLMPGATYGASAWARVRMTNGVTDPAEGISFKVGDGEATAFAGEQIGTSQFYITNIMASGTADAEGKLTISFVVEGANVSWLSWKNVYYWMESLPVIEADFAYNEGGTMATVTTEYTPAEGNMLVAYVSYDFSEPYAMFEDGKVEVAPRAEDFWGAAAHLVVTIREVKYDEATEEFVTVAEGQVELDFAREIPAMAGDSQENAIELATGWSEAIAKDDCGTDEQGYTWFTYTAEEAGTFVFSCNYPTSFGDEDGMAEVESPEVRNGYGKKVAKGEVITFSAYLPGAWWNEDTQEMVSIDELMFYANVTPAEAEVPLYEILNLAVEECEGWEPGFVQEETVSVVAYTEDSFIIRGIDGVEGNDATIVFDENDNVVSVNGVTEGFVTVGKYIIYVAAGYCYASGNAEEGYALLTAYVGDDYGYYYIAWGATDSEMPENSILENGNAADEYGEVACAWGKENQGNPHAADIEVVDDTHVFVVHATAKASEENNGQPWDNQFWICAPRKFYVGDKIKVTFRYKAAKAAKIPTQAHCAPSDYNHWACIGDVSFTTEWQTYEAEVTVTKEIAGGEDRETAKGFQSIAFNLSEFAEANDYYFDDLTWEILEDGDGVASVKANVANDVIYDLAGRRVSKAVKGGIYIINGKKVVIK